MLDDQTPTIESPEHQSAAEENMSEYYIDEPVPLQKDVELRQHTNVSKKRLKSKKKGYAQNIFLQLYAVANFKQIDRVTVTGRTRCITCW